MAGNVSSMEVADALLQKSASALRPIVDEMEDELDEEAGHLAQEAGIAVWQFEAILMLGVLFVLCTVGTLVCCPPSMCRRGSSMDAVLNNIKDSRLVGSARSKRGRYDRIAVRPEV